MWIILRKSTAIQSLTMIMTILAVCPVHHVVLKANQEKGRGGENATMIKMRKVDSPTTIIGNLIGSVILDDERIGAGVRIAIVSMIAAGIERGRLIISFSI